ncbi:MAG: efflux RND transporter periplasmic adaptor subunit [Deltaproteobacteria bacterium]|nr:efflux RND transporter periplasmic adaptor subunit [Deltaproteobacteria bacterium]
MKTGSEYSSRIKETLGIDHPVSARKRAIVLVVAALIATALIAGVAIHLYSRKNASIQYKTAEVQRGNLTVVVTATGNLKPVNQVDVGTELSGTVSAVLVDYNDRVKAGQVLARMDTEKLESQALKSGAALESAKAKLLQAQVTFLERRNEYQRLLYAGNLSDGKAVSQRDLVAAEAALRRAEADETSAKAQVAEAEATLAGDKTNLSKAIIRSPIDGIVLDRKIEPGQTVAASLSAPVLFTIAENLSKMELHVDVDEADVGRVKKNLMASFAVDAYPDRRFPAKITEVHQVSQKVNGVVTYESVLSVSNADLSLRPGMTATADITVNKVEGALLVPNAALRFIPPESEEKPSGDDGGLLGKLIPHPPKNSSTAGSRVQPASGKSQRVWVLRDGTPKPLSVTVGVTDGKMTEVISGDVRPGLTLIVDFERIAK